MSFDHLIGLPWRELGRDYDGVDCWGIIYLHHKRRGVEIPRYDGRGWVDGGTEQVEKLVDEARTLWQPIRAGDERPGDLVHLRIAGHPVHVGLVVGEGMMLHVTPHVGYSFVETYLHERWRRRILGFYRWL